MGNFWFRCHNDIINDPKIRILAFEDRWHYIAICCMKSEGDLDKNYKPELRDRFIATQLGISIIDLDSVKKRLLEVLLIDENWQPLGWDKRQFISDKKDPTAADRQKRYRENKKLKDSNGSVTASLRPEIDLEKEKETYKTLPDELNKSAWKEYLEYRKSVRAVKLKPKSEEKLITWLIEQGSHETQQKIVDQSDRNGWKGLFELKGSNNNGQNQQDNRSRAQRVSDKLDEIARKDIERNGFTSELD